MNIILVSVLILFAAVIIYVIADKILSGADFFKSLKKELITMLSGIGLIVLSVLFMIIKTYFEGTYNIQLDILTALKWILTLVIFTISLIFVFWTVKFIKSDDKRSMLPLWFWKYLIMFLGFAKVFIEIYKKNWFKITVILLLLLILFKLF